MSQVSLIPCTQCGYESPDNAKFCRSCGALLVTETEASAAGTRHYGRQEPLPQHASAPLPSQPLPPPSVVDAFGEETRRQAYVPPAAVSNTNPFATPPVPQYTGYAPIAPQYGAYIPPAAPPTSKRRRILKWGLAGSALALAIGFGAAINDSDNNARLSPQEFRILEEARSEGRLNDNLIRGFDEARSRADREINDRIRQVERARDEARRAADRGNKNDLTGIPLLDLDKYEFGQATISSAIRIPGKEMRQQYVNSDFGYLVQHYEKLLGKPIILDNGEDDDEKRALFQSPATADQPSVSVLIKHSNKDEGQWEILALRSPFNFARPNAGIIAPPPPPPPAPPADVETVPNGKAPVSNGPATDSAKPVAKPVR